MLRDYQKTGISMLYDWMSNNDGNPCLVMPTGSGKSHIVAALCKDALQNWPETRILMLTGQKELIEQNAEKMLLHWPSAPLGIYSASIGKRQLGMPITFAGIQSVAKRAIVLGHVDLMIVDECHAINHKEEGGYRTLIAELLKINPHMRVIGLTATPYRLGHGYITDKPAIFDALIQPVSIDELIKAKHIAPLRSKLTSKKLDVTGVAKRGGDYIESELQAAVDTSDINSCVVNEVIEKAGHCKSWLFFCSGVEHAEHVRDELQRRGIIAECITGKTSKKDRERIINDFKAGKIQALTNANVLTTGFDAPNIDLIVMLRPTLSTGLYVQMAGRGMRLKEHTDHCIVMDFAGVVETHGPITNVNPPRRKGERVGGEAPVKVCDNCHELVHLSTKICPSCGMEFPIDEKEKQFKLRNHDIMGVEGVDMTLSGWNWRPYISRTSGKEMIKVTYYGESLDDETVSEYLCIKHEGYAGHKAVQLMMSLATRARVTLPQSDELEDICQAMNDGEFPAMIEYKKDGKFYSVLDRVWRSE